MHHSLHCYHKKVQCSSNKFPPNTVFFMNAVSLSLGLLAIFTNLSDAVTYLRLQRETFISIVLDCRKVTHFDSVLRMAFPTQSILYKPLQTSSFFFFFLQENLLKYPVDCHVTPIYKSSSLLVCPGFILAII